MDLPGLIEELQVVEPQYRDLQSARTRLINQAKASCRRHTDGDKAEAVKLYKIIYSGGEVPDGLWHVTILASQIRQLTSELRLRQKQIEFLAKQLPVWDWAAPVPGLGALGLGRLVAEAGDLSNYANPARLWARFGLGRKRYGEEVLTQRRYADASKAIAAGFSPRRRALAFVIWEPMLKARKKSVYTEAYYTKKQEYTGRGWVKAHAHAAAGRFATKRLFRDLWVAWQHHHTKDGNQEHVATPDGLASVPCESAQSDPRQRPLEECDPQDH